MGRGPMESNSSGRARRSGTDEIGRRTDGKREVARGEKSGGCGRVTRSVLAERGDVLFYREASLRPMPAGRSIARCPPPTSFSRSDSAAERPRRNAPSERDRTGSSPQPRSGSRQSSSISFLRLVSRLIRRAIPFVSLVSLCPREKIDETKPE